MGTKIDMVSIAPLPGVKTARKTLWLAKKAAVMCLKESGIPASEIELIVFAGIYRDKHIGEPSIASLLQKEIGINPELYPINNRTFSFDLNGGGCGLINSFEVISGFMESGKISRAMVITGDSEPINGLSETFKFSASGAAVILSKTNSNEGFGMIRNYTYPEHENSFGSYISWKKKEGKLRERNILVIEQSDNYLEECILCSIDSLRDFLKRNKLSLNDIKYIVPSQSPAGFADGLESRLKGKATVMKLNNSKKSELHTSGPAFALRKVWDTGGFEGPGKILFLAVGSGISNALALYSPG